jgi:hypothetical protein
MRMATAPMAPGAYPQDVRFRGGGGHRQDQASAGDPVAFQDCTGCTETLLRTSAPEVAHLVLDVLSLDHQETLTAASAAQAEAGKADLESARFERSGSAVDLGPPPADADE